MEKISRSRMLDMLDEQELFRKIFQHREVFFGAVDDDPARHAAENLLRDDAVRMRVIPEESGTLAVTHRDLHLVLEVLARVNMDKDIVAVALGDTPMPWKCRLLGSSGRSFLNAIRMTSPVRTLSRGGR